MCRFLLTLPFILFSFVSHTQIKYEKEIRLKDDLVPLRAKEFISALSFSSKVKWYKETGLNSTSIEAKTKHLGTRYSIEFSPDGTLEDAELKVEFEELPTRVSAKITAYLEEKYAKYVINKIQVQYSGVESEVLAFLKSKNSQLKVETKYELVISTKVESSFKSYEYLFSKTGDFIQSATIVKSNTVNIEF